MCSRYLFSSFFSTGAVTIRIGMPSNMQASLIFHYNLKFYDNDTDTFETISLKRFVMQVCTYFAHDAERISFLKIQLTFCL